MLKSPLTFAVPRVSLASPVFVTVMFLAMLVVPIWYLPHVSGSGDSWACGPASPVPDNPTGVLFTVRMPVRRPAAVGVKSMR